MTLVVQVMPAVASEAPQTLPPSPPPRAKLPRVPLAAPPTNSAENTGDGERRQGPWKHWTQLGPADPSPLATLKHACMGCSVSCRAPCPRSACLQSV